MRLEYHPPRWNRRDWSVTGHYLGRRLSISDPERRAASWRVVSGLLRGEKN